MPLDPNIYQQMQPNLASQLAGSVNQFTEQRARLSDLAQQREFQQSQMARQNQLQDYQIRGLQREEAAYPEQQRLAAQSRAEKAKQDIALGIYGGLTNNKSQDEINVWVNQKSAEYGLPKEQVSELLAPLNTGQDMAKTAEFYRQQAGGRKLFEQEQEAMIKQQFTPEKTSAPSQINTLMQERAKIAALNPNDPNLRIMDQAIQKAVTQPLVQIAGVSGESPIYATPSQAIGRQVPQKTGKEPQLSAQAQKELFEADETIQASSNVIGLLDQAKALNKTAYSGYGAKQRAIARSNLPGSSEEADATINLDNIMTSQALESLKAIFGGMPTEGERKILMDIQASVDKTPSQRESIMNRAKTAVENRIKFSTEKANKLRAGEYFKPTQPTTQQQSIQTGGAKFLGFE